MGEGTEYYCMVGSLCSAGCGVVGVVDILLGVVDVLCDMLLDVLDIYSMAIHTNNNLLYSHQINSTMCIHNCLLIQSRGALALMFISACTQGCGPPIRLPMAARTRWCVG